ncbi:TIR domain-containing protein [Lentzea atacamensis]|uniref:TIR domain-containing protein n=1 Tax=Lentzea atacamensis TaxID=531938 RepID=A0ABX9DZ52_9PSEU|nr:TIR domain-containing protein [Lentzea atacamensis]RAS61123.1 TIR domain-containing protein [Lentzea atacamensis]
MAIFVSYSCSDGRPAAAAVVDVLREHTFDVLWDADLSAIHPMSIQAWMETAVRDRIVVVIVSPAYLKALLSNDFVERRGVRYELGLIRQKLYHHDSANGCGVVVVVPPGIEMNSLPAVLQQLVAHSFDPGTRSGEEELVRSLRALEGQNGDAPSAVTEGEGVRHTRTILSALQALPPFSDHAHALAQELAERGTGDFELVWAFESVVAVAKAHGDVRLVRRLSELCLRTLSSMPPLKGKGELEAKVLIAGQSWHLLRERRFSLAVSVAEDGTLIAEKCRDLKTVARGKRAQARVALHIAAAGRGQDRAHYLAKCEHLLMVAKTLFRSIGGPASEELGVCASLHAEMQLLRYDETGERDLLDAAVRRAQEAEKLLTPGTEPYHWVTVLQARLCLADKRYDEGKKLATAVIATADFPEVVARARQVRADLMLATRKRAAAVRDLIAAEESFRRLGCDYAADMCWWTIAKYDASQVTDVPLTAADLGQLEALAPDPGDRRRAVLEHESTAPRRLGRSAPDWARLVDRVQHE